MGSSSGPASASSSSRAPARCWPPSRLVAPTTGSALTSVLLTLAYAVGVAVPLLGPGAGGPRTTPAVEGAAVPHAPAVRRVAGVVLGLTALAIVLNLTTPVCTTALPGYTSALEDHMRVRRRDGRPAAGPCRASTGTTRSPTRPPPPGPCPTSARRRTSPASPSGSTPPAAGRSPWRRCGARSCWSTSGPTRASTAARSLPARRGLVPRVPQGRARGRRRAHPRVPLRARGVAT